MRLAPAITEAEMNLGLDILDECLSEAERHL